MTNIKVIIPAYNEAGSIAQVIAAIPALVSDIIVVNNNSTDATSEVAKKAGAIVLLEKNKTMATGAYFGVIIRNGLQRNTDAAIAIVGLKFKKLEVGFNYDFNVSELRAATNSRGAYEFSIVYTGASSVLQKTAVPCDRF